MASTDQSKVQHVNRASSDELLRKFAEMESAVDSSRKKEDPKRRKRNRTNQDSVDHEKDSSKNSKGLVERRSLLPTVNRRSSALLRQFGIGRCSQLRAREIKNRSLIGAIEKTWRKTVEGASKVFIDKHYNRHKRLINDVV